MSVNTTYLPNIMIIPVENIKILFMVNMSSAGREQAEPKLFGRIHNVVIFVYIYIETERSMLLLGIALQSKGNIFVI